MLMLFDMLLIWIAIRLTDNSLASDGHPSQAYGVVVNVLP